jgi:uncharacterized protein YpmS
MGEIKFVTSIVLFSLFTLAIVTYAIGFASDNNAPVDLADEDGFNRYSTEITSNQSQFVNNVNTSSDSFMKSSIEYGNDVMNSGNSFKIILFTMPMMINSALNLAKTYLFGGSAAFGAVLTVISTMLLYIGIRYIYKTWAGKDPD